MITIGMVVEGSHDLIMLEPLIAHEIKRSFNEEVNFLRLQPTPDATGTFNGGGWARVVAWCADNAGSGLETFFRPLFAGETACDAIVIHVDGDALELMSHIISPWPKLTNPGPNARVSALVAALEGWLNAESTRKSQFAFAVPVLQSEAWILAAEQSSLRVEAMNAKKEFQKSYNHKTHKTLGKFYSGRVSGAQGGVGHIPRVCFSYNQFRSSISKLKY